MTRVRLRSCAERQENTECDRRRMRSTAFYAWDDVPCWLDARDLSTLLRLSKSSVYGLYRQPSFPCLKLGRRMITPKDKLKEWLEYQMEITEID